MDLNPSGESMVYAWGVLVIARRLYCYRILTTTKTKKCWWMQMSGKIENQLQIVSVYPPESGSSAK
jgi:hypothetical protein